MAVAAKPKKAWGDYEDGNWTAASEPLQTGQSEWAEADEEMRTAELMRPGAGEWVCQDWWRQELKKIKTQVQ